MQLCDIIKSLIAENMTDSGVVDDLASHHYLLSNSGLSALLYNLIIDLGYLVWNGLLSVATQPFRDSLAVCCHSSIQITFLSVATQPFRYLAVCCHTTIQIPCCLLPFNHPDNLSVSCHTTMQIPCCLLPFNHPDNLSIRRP